MQRRKRKKRKNLSLLVQHLIRCHHVVNDVALGDFLGAELSGSRQVLSVVVAQVVVGHNGSGLETSTDQEVNQHRLHLGLAALEVIATNVDVVLLGEINQARHKSVLWRTIDVGATLENRGSRKDLRRGNLGFVAIQ